MRHVDSEKPMVLRSGTLRLSVEHAEMPLADLCGYASRRSRKRGFVFVSKVLGKHYPVRPRVMADVYSRLASSLANVPGPVVIIAMAETATGLGQGIYEEWLRSRGRSDVLFIHSTRYRLRRPLAFDFDENHSHATQHLLYQPAEAKLAQMFRNAVTLVLVDDEISTGRTLTNLALAFRRVNPQVLAVHLMCLTDWLGVDRHRDIADRIGLPTSFHSLLRGSFTFEENGAFDPGPIPIAEGAGDFKDLLLPANHGRLGRWGLLRFDLDAMIDASEVRPGERILVLGSGEFAHPPYLLARRLEERGFDVFFQSTSRSPLLVDADITSVEEFADNYHDGIANYLYNFSDRHYDRVLIGYETNPLPGEHQLPERIRAKAVYFTDEEPRS